MAPETTGKKGPGPREKTYGEKTLFGFTKVEVLPLALALQGLVLFVLAFMLSAPPRAAEESAAGVGTTAGPVRTASQARVPADLLPERIELPRFPSPDARREKHEARAPKGEKQESSGTGLSLAALRVDSVSYDAIAAVQLAVALPGAPDRIAAGQISQARFTGEGVRGQGPRGREGWGGVGVEAIVGRTGGSCGRAHQAPPPPHIVERTMALPFR